MTDQTPADELRAAAERLHSWIDSEPRQAWGPSAITAFSPALAEWLEAEASDPIVDAHSDRCTERSCTINAALAVARQILDTQESP